MKKILVYPYTYENSLLAFYENSCQLFEIKGFLIDSFSLYVGRDATFYSKDKSNVYVYGVNEISNLIFDGVLVTQIYSDIELENYLKIERFAIENGKKIYVFDEIVNTGIIKNLNSIEILGEREKNLMLDGNFHEIDIPIISIMSTGLSCDKLDVQLLLTDLFTKNGYKTLAIGSNKYSEFFGIKYYPDFMFSKEISLDKKIIMFNNYIYKLLKEDKVDILILSVPGGILRSNNQNPNFFGELAYVISEALLIDINILCVNFTDDLTIEYLEKVREICRIRYNRVAEYINISATASRLKPSENGEEDEIEYINLTYRFVKENFPKICGTDAHIFCAKYYLGDVPNEENVLLQLTEGIEVL